MSTPANAVMRAELFEILKEKSFRTGQFILASGKTSNYYLDCRISTLTGRGAYLIGHLLYPEIASLYVDAVGGMSIGADPIVSAITYASAEAGHPLNGFLIRKEAKGHGTGRQIEGNLSSWMRAVLVEDVVTTGSSTLKAIEVIKATYPSVQIAKVFSIVDREAGGQEAFTQAGVPYQSLYSVREFLAE